MSGESRLRAPREHGAVLAEPPLAEAPGLLEHNRHRLDQTSFELLGRPFADLRRLARHTALQTAHAYFQDAGEPLPELPSSPAVVLAGHQPELFHPGVWVKNFALNGLARKAGAVPLNLVIDTDTAKTAALKLPGCEAGGSLAACPPEAVRRWTLPFDRWTRDTPYEERPVLDEALFASLPDRAGPLVDGWGYEPLLGEFWQEATRQARRTELLGERFAAARRVLERRWGCHNLEVPMSGLCRTEPFAWFVCHLLAELPRFHRAYNDSVQEYRQAHGIRSRLHPVPDLAADGEWLEVPFWAWHRGRARHGRLFARAGAGAVALRVGGEAGPVLPLRAGADPGRAVAALAAAGHDGLQLRTRALTTTLYARLFLGELFIHGIGGALYDAITDALVRRFYGFEPPGYLALSATQLLPLPTYPATPDDCRRLARQLHDLRCNPQRHLPASSRGDPEVARLLAARNAWVGRRPTDRAGRRERFVVLKALTQQLGRFLEGQQQTLSAELEHGSREVAANALLRRRDYAFCLFPEAGLRPFLTAFL